MTVLVDSDILIEISRGVDAEILRNWAELGESEDVILCSPVTVAELWHGARPKEFDLIANLFRTLLCVSIDSETGRQAGDYLRKYRKSHNVELGDAMIASAAMLHGATLWTRNKKHYPMEGLKFY